MIVAVDFDGTLVEDKYPEIGSPNRFMVDLIKAHKQSGDKVVLWTCRNGEYLTAAIHWCDKQGIELDSVNTNLPEIQEKYGGDTRKLSADVYYDDHAIEVTFGKPILTPSTYRKFVDIWER